MKDKFPEIYKNKIYAYMHDKMHKNTYFDLRCA